MSNTSFPPFLKWGSYKSRDEKNPDIIHVEIIEPEPFPTQYDWNVLCKVDTVESNIPLRAKSANKKLYKRYNELLNQGKIKSGTCLTIKTWLGKSTKNPEWDLRNFEVNSSS